MLVGSASFFPLLPPAFKRIEISRAERKGGIILLAGGQHVAQLILRFFAEKLCVAATFSIISNPYLGTPGQLDEWDFVLWLYLGRGRANN